MAVLDCLISASANAMPKTVVMMVATPTRVDDRAAPDFHITDRARKGRGQLFRA
ncbi:hypothetical protein [Salinisphaera sp. RV14]|uniref:hypothetical protein n=1 Tax=Salinisphaera sp. RV14 TaxID=3454140 RepID=UPI003F82C2A2